MSPKHPDAAITPPLSIISIVPSFCHRHLDLCLCLSCPLLSYSVLICLAVQ